MKRTIGSVLVLVAGLFFFSIGVRDAIRASEQADWLPVQATVLTSRVDVDTSSGGRSYRPLISYHYQVGDEDFESRRLSLAQGGWNKNTAEAFVDRHPIGANTTAFYDPRQPELAVLSKSAQTSVLVAAIVIGLVLIIVGVRLLRNARTDNDPT